MEKAKELFQEALKDDPDNKKAKLYIKKQIPRRELKIKNDKIKRLYDEGRAYFNHDQLDEAEAVFTELVAFDPTHKSARRHLEEFIPERRITIKTQAIKKLYDQGYAHFYRGNYRDAQVAFEEILSLDSAQADAREYVSQKIPAALKIDLLYKEALKLS